MISHAIPGSPPLHGATVRPVRWGILGAADIAVQWVIPALQRCANAEVVAIASRDLARAQATAERLGIARAYGSYEDLLADPQVEAIYNPLPNHLHVPWTLRAAEAGKHVLCEKPIALNALEAQALVAVQARTGVQIAEAFMVRTHPQWQQVRDTDRRRAHRRPATDRRALQLLPTRSERHPQPGRMGRRGAA